MRNIPKSLASGVILLASLAVVAAAAPAPGLLAGKYFVVSLRALRGEVSGAMQHGPQFNVSLGFEQLVAVVANHGPEGDDLFLVGSSKGMLSPLTSDDLSTLLQCAQLPSLVFSLEPKGGTFAQKKLIPTFFGGGGDRSSIGESLYRADVLMKELAFGRKPLRVPGLKSYSDRIKEEMARKGSGWSPPGPSRFWFVPVAVPWQPSDQGDVVLHKGTCVVVGLEPWAPAGSAVAAPDEVADAFIRDFNHDMDAVIEAQPEIANMLRFVSALSLLKVVKKSFSTPGQNEVLAYWCDPYRPSRVLEIPLEIDLIEQVERSAGRELRFYGGVRLGSLSWQLGKGGQDLGALKKAVLATRPPGAVRWPFTIDKNWNLSSPVLSAQDAKVATDYAAGLNEYEKALASANPISMERTLSLLDKVLKVCPDSPEPTLLRACAARDLARFRGAVRDLPLQVDRLTRLVAAQPAYLDAKHELAKTLVMLNRPNEAIPLLTELLKTAPGFVTARQTLGLAYLGAGQRDRAKEHLTAFLATQKDPPDRLAIEARKALDILNGTGPAGGPEAGVFDNPRLGLSFNFSKSWRLLTSDEMQRVYPGAPADNTLVAVACQPESPDNNINLRLAPYPEDSLTLEDIQEAIPLLASAYAKQFNGFRQLKAGPITVAGGNAVRFDFLSNRAGVGLRQTVVTFVKYKQSLTLTFTAREKDFETARKASFDEALASLRWEK